MTRTQPYTPPRPFLYSGKPRLRSLLGLTITFIHSVGVIAIGYCFIMVTWPEIAEFTSVHLSALIARRAPRNGDYRFAWIALVYVIPIALLMVLRILVFIGHKLVYSK